MSAAAEGTMLPVFASLQSIAHGAEERLGTCRDSPSNSSVGRGTQRAAGLARGDAAADVVQGNTVAGSRGERGHAQSVRGWGVNHSCLLDDDVHAPRGVWGICDGQGRWQLDWVGLGPWRGVPACWRRGSTLHDGRRCWAKKYISS